jgi:putative holliday junction resolvase
LKVVALDFGSARTGVAVSDPTGTIARPLTIVSRAGTDPGFDELVRLLADEGAELVVVGLPLTLRGEAGAQAAETSIFVDRLRRSVSVPVVTFDERFTTVLAGGDDARAAAHLLTGYLEWSKTRT